MILVSKAEAELIRKSTPSRILITSRTKQGRRKRYYAEERPEVYQILKHTRQAAN